MVRERRSEVYSGSRNPDFRQSAPGLSLCERRPAAVTDDPIFAAHTRKPIDIVPGRGMGLFRNNIVSLFQSEN